MKKSLLALLFLPGLAFAQTPNTAQLDWTNPTTYSDGTPITGLSVNIYQGLQGASKAKVGNVTGQTATINSGLLSGKTYCWDLTSQVGTTESAHSTEACKTFPPATLPAPSALTAK